MKEKFKIKDIWYGLLHVMVAMSSILFVCGTTGINLPLSFLTIGIGTLIFHFFTKNKLSVLMGVSGSFIGGMAIVSSTYGPSYVAGGVVMAGIIYLAIGAIIKKKPKLYSQFPEYILNMGVILIALNLLPIGSSMASENILVSAFTVIVGFTIFVKGGKKLSAWAFPLALIGGTLLAAITTGLVSNGDAQTLAFTMPKFNLSSFSLVGVVAFAVAFEALADTHNCANAQGIKLKGDDFGNALLGNGVASTLSGLLGGLPLTTYSENVGFIHLTGYKRPAAQLISSVIFIIMAFIPGIGVLISYIPTYVYGGLLLILFSCISINSIRSLFLNKDTSQVAMIMITTFFLVPSSVFSPIAAALLVGIASHFIIVGKKKRY